MNTTYMVKPRQKSASYFITFILVILMLVNGYYASTYFIPNPFLKETVSLPLWIKGVQILLSILNIFLIVALLKKYKLGLFGIIFTSALSFSLIVGIGLDIKHSLIMGVNLFIALAITIPFWKKFTN